MIFLHGFMDNGMCYDRVAKQFQKNFNLLLPDARGHGKTSDPPKEKFTYEDMAQKYTQAQQEFITHYPSRNIKILKSAPKGEEILPKIKVPILLITSDKGVVPKKYARK